MTFTFTTTKENSTWKYRWKNLNPTLKINMFTYRYPFITNHYYKSLVTFHIHVPIHRTAALWLRNSCVYYPLQESSSWKKVSFTLAGIFALDFFMVEWYFNQVHTRCMISTWAFCSIQLQCELRNNTLCCCSGKITVS